MNPIEHHIRVGEEQHRIEMITIGIFLHERGIRLNDADQLHVLILRERLK